MPLENVPPPIQPPALPLPSLADRVSYGPRRREWLRWEHEDLTPGVQAFAGNVYSNAEFASQMAAQAASVAGFLGDWDDQIGPAVMPASVLHNDVFWVLLANVADITAHEPGVSVVWAEFSEAATAEATLFDNTGTGMLATQVQAAIVELLSLLATKIGRISPTGSVRSGSRTTLQREVMPQVGDRAWNPDLNAGRGDWETWNGAAWEQDGWVTGSLVGLSGSQVDFVGVPASVNEIKIRLRQASTTGSANLLFQLGTAVGFEATGYESSGDGESSAAGFLVLITSAGNSITGEAVFQRGPGNSWDYRFSGTSVSTNRAATGFKTMTGPSTRIRFLPGGSTTFDSGTAYVMWRK